jgi:hypothetical protein
LDRECTHLEPDLCHNSTVTRPHSLSSRLVELGARPIVQTMLVVAAAVVVLVATGVPLLEVTAYGLYLALILVLPGCLIWRWATEFDRTPTHGPAPAGLRTRLEDLVCGCAVGYILELPSYVLARWLGHPRLFVLVPLTILVVLGVREARRFRHGPARTAVGPLGRGMFTGLTIYLFVWLCVVGFSKFDLGVGHLLDADEPFHLALVGELRHHFPPQYPYIDFGQLNYQWFVHAHMAASSWATGIAPETLYLRFEPLVMTTLTVLGAAVIAMRLSGRIWPGAAASAILVLVGSFDITGIVPGEAGPEERLLQIGILVNSPTMTFAFALSTPVVVLILEHLRPNGGLRTRSWVLLIACMGALAGAKVTVLPLVFCGYALVTVLGLFMDRRLVRPAATGTLVTLAVVLLSGWVLYSGDTQTLRIEPLHATRGFMNRYGMDANSSGPLLELLVTFTLIASWLVPGAGAIGLLRDRQGEQTPGSGG